jgi:hypothetical protein
MEAKTNYESCFEEIKAYCTKQLSRFVERGLTHAEKQCTELLISAEVDSDEKDTIDQARQYLFSQKQMLAKTYIEDFALALMGEKAVTEKTKADTLSLALVDDDTLDEMIVIGELSGKIQDYYDSHLKTLKRGLVRLSKKLDIKPEPEALTPKKLLQLLHEPLSASDLRLAGKKRIYKFFADAAQVELKILYDGVLALLQESEIITEQENPSSANFKIIYQYRQNQGISSPGATAQAGTAEQATAAPPLPGIPAIPAGEVPTLRVPGVPDANEIPTLRGEPGVPVAPTGASQPLAPASLSPVSARAIDPSLFRSSTSSQAVYGFLNRTAPVQTDTGGKPLPTVDSTEILKVLSSLQNLNTLELSQLALKDSASIGQKVNEAIAAKTSEWAKQLSGPEANVIELVNSMFVAIFEDPELIDPVKVQIGRLQIPYIKVALLDVTLLDKEAHPARLLLNELSLQGVRINATNDPLMALVTSIIRNILDNFETDLSVFSSNLEQLREATKTREAAASEAEEGTRQKAESQAKLLHVKKHIISRLRQYLKGKTLPKELHGLLLKGFAPLLLKIYRKEGEQSEDWKNTLFLLRQVVESVQPRDSAFQLGAVLEHSSVIIRDAQSAIQLLPKKLADSSLVNGLKEIYENLAIKHQSLKSVQDEEPAENRIDPLALDPDDKPEPDPALLNQPTPEELLAQLPEQIRAGTWCEVYLGRDEEPRRLKVSSILHDTAQLVFVDSTGAKSEIKDIRDFLDELDCERSRVLPNEQLFDKALTAVINNMNLMRAVS